MSNKTTEASGGIGFTGMLTILFIGLKLAGYISWSWWWVLSPIWISFSLFFSIIAVGLFVAIVVLLAGSKK